ncbi:MAG: hypothetical protein AVDCRST_MAG48-1568 [uncultured Friedmanniella sp.]|uniref:Proposed peptidoglycan lipid II flippase MurJ n=1 Tax=uncultured Friedmanniella sp. TaxID=335381 RepID=A0A6J4KGD9_9ACTN|nr:MAG: hypothetical protein AVDCRST_MAG48-1568 [uncultured Friedmanniella sp.]
MGARLARISVSVAGWTALSRISGFGRVAVVAAVLGPTYLGNVFQASNNLPNLVYMALTGTLFSSLLVPPMVRLIDRGDRREAERLAGAFLGAALVAFAIVAVLVNLAAPVLLDLLTVGVEAEAEAAGQRTAGRVLLLLCMPQLLLYAVTGTCEAVMNAHDRFALPSAAPIAENLGVIVTMVATALIFGTGAGAATVSTSQLVLMGAGSTLSVGLHAAIQWWGVRSIGVRLVPRAGWKEQEIRAITRRAGPSLGYSSLDVLQRVTYVAVANRIPGGVVGFDLAMNFYTLPAALGARPVGVALLPHLARLHVDRRLVQFRDELVRGASLMLFLVVPAAVAFGVLAGPIARGLTFGAMATPEGQLMLASALLGLCVGVLGECALLLGIYAAYARGDARSPLLAGLVRLGTATVGIGVTVTMSPGAAGLLALGLVVSAADLAGAAFLALRLHAALPGGHERLRSPLLRSATATVVTVVPALAVAATVPELLPRGGPQGGVLLACLVGGLVYLIVQALLGSPELRSLQTVLSRGRGDHRD